MTDTGRGFLDFAGRSVVVTGASSGLGRACAEELAHHGARVVLIGRNAERLGEVHAGMAGDGHEVLVLDLNELDRIGPEIVRISGVVGRIYGFCHAAGIVDTRPLGVTTADTVQRLMTVNVYAGLELAKAIVRRDVMDPEGGSLVFLSSIYGNVGVPGEIGYSATKGAIAAAVRAMAIELARRRVRVNTVSPGLVMTPMTDSALGDLTPEQVAAIEQKHPLGLGTPSHVARAALFLLAPATSWITGTELIVDGGYSAQ